MPPSLTPALFRLGATLLGAYIDWNLWSHRKVEAISLLEGSNGRRRVSVDCTPPQISLGRVKGFPESISPSARLVPVTLMAKQTLRSLDVSDAAGCSVPVLGAESNGLLAAAQIAFVIQAECDRSTAAARWPTIQAIAMGEPGRAEKLALELVRDLNLSALAESVLTDLALNFLLVAVVPKGKGERLILKFSYHWEAAADLAEDARSRKRFGRLLRMTSAGLGWSSYALDVSVGAPQLAHSYHLECAAPQGLVIESISLPADDSGLVPRDSAMSAVGHAHGHYAYTDRPMRQAVVRFGIAPVGLLPRAFVAALGVACMFFVILIPTGISTLSLNTDATVALLLFVPAVLIALNARDGENSIVRGVLGTLRVVSVGLSGMLFVAGVQLVLQVPASIAHPTWIVLGSAAAATAIALAAGFIRSAVRSWR